VQRARRQRLVHAGHRVVVGQREQAHAGGGGVLHHLGGRELAVGVERVRLQVEAQGAGEVSHSTGMPWRIVFSVTTLGSTNWSR
jgi:hypothetical protein